MIYRLASIFIVFFWLTMTALLFRNEWWPGYSAMREVPVEYVVRLLLVHGESSDLNILNEKITFGHLHLHPVMRKEDNTRAIDFTGDAHIHIPGMEPENVDWRGDWKLDKALATSSFHIALTLKKPGPATMDLRVFPAENRAHYSITSGAITQDMRDFTLDAAGARAFMQQMGLDPSLLDAAQSAHAEKPVIKAQQSFLEVHGGRLETYKVTVEQSGQTLLEFHVDQLGRILQVKTLIGYSLAPDDLVR